MVNFNFHGLMPAVLTPFKDDYSIDLRKIPIYVEFLQKNNIKGILVNGTSGEGMSMSVEERKMVAEVWVREAHNAGMHVMLQIGGAPLPDVITLASHAESIKVDSILCLPELFNKPKSVDELVGYLDIVSKVAPNTPFLYYHNPAMSGVLLDMPKFVREAKIRIKTFKGLKFTSTNLKEGNEVLKECGDDYTVFLGGDQLLLAALASGFTCSIGTTYSMLMHLGDKVLRLLDVVSIVGLEKVRNTQNDINTAVNIITSYGEWVPAMKVAMEIITDIRVGPPRPPLHSLTDDQIKKMRDELMEKGFINRK